MATLEETLKKLGLATARGVPQLATGFVDLAALPFTMTGMLKPEQAVGSTAYLTSKGLLPPEQKGLLGETTEIVSGALNPATATKAALAKGGLLAVPMAASGIITPKVAKEIPMPVNLPKTEEFISAIQNTPTAQITDEGLLLRVQRGQQPAQAGKESVRTGVFYLPEGSSNAKWYSKTRPGIYYGGDEKIAGETLLKNPLFVKGATGGKAPEMAFDAVKGKGSIKELDNEVNRILSMDFIKRKDPELYYEEVGKFLSKYGSDPSKARYIVENSQRGNQLRYALRENAIANTVRNAGYDSVLGYSKGKKGNFLSEIFDVRESTYPTKEGGFTLNPMFEQK
jgi:hypothetical protein